MTAPTTCSTCGQGDKAAAAAPEVEPPLAFIYDRRATPNVAALDARLAACRDFAQARGWPLAGEYVDTGADAISGDSRPILDVLCAVMAGAAPTGPVVCLLTDWDRIARDPYDSARLRRRVAQAGGYCATAEGEHDRATGPAHTP